MNKRDFMNALRNGLNFLPPQDLAEIMDEFEQHFQAGLEQGRTEQDLIDQLGDPNRIIEGYRTEVLGDTPPPIEPEPQREERTSPPPRSGGGSGFASSVNIHERYPAGKIRLIQIEAVDSDVVFVLSEGDEVRVDIEGSSASTIYAQCDNGVLHVAQEFRLFKLLHWGREPEFRITLPALFQGALETSTASGDIRLPDFKGQACKIQTVSGDFRLGDVYASENLFFKSISGDMRAGKSMAESIDIATTSGDIKFGDLTTNRLGIDTVSGDIEQAPGSVWEARNLRIKTVSGDIRIALNDHWQQMDFVTVSGDIDLILPQESAHFEVQLSSVSGKLKNQLGNDSYSGRLIKAKTVSGDLKIKKQ